MQRLVTTAMAAIAAAALAVQGYLIVPAVLREPGSASAMHLPQGPLALVAGLLVQLLTGRLVLSFLPPGHPGSHSLRGLAATAACSFFLGGSALDLEQRLWPGLERAGPWSQILGLLPWLLLAAVRLATLPAAMVPRHEVRAQRTGPLAACVLALAVLWSLVELRLDPGFAPWEWFVFLALSAHALATARRAPLGRMLVILGGALSLTPLQHHHPATQAAARFGLGAVFLVPWIRRADRRAGVLAILAFASLASVRETGLALAGLAGLLVASPGRLRARALATSLVAALLLIAPWEPPLAMLLESGGGTHPGANLPAGPWGLRDLLEASLTTAEWGVAWLFLVLAGFAGLGILAGWAASALDPRAKARDPARIEDPWREALALALLAGLAYWALQLWPSRCGNPSAAALILFPVALLLAGLVLVPAERPGERAMP